MSYVPANTKDLKDVMYFPTDADESERVVLIKILDRIINDYTGGGESSDN